MKEEQKSTSLYIASFQFDSRAAKESVYYMTQNQFIS